MLAIRLQRTGRKGHAQYRVVVQDSRMTPTSERVVYRLGNYDPHAKTLNIDTEKATFYLQHGAQPSDRIARLLMKEGVKLPDWVKISESIKRDIRNPEKLRKNQPEEPKNEQAETKQAEETSVEKSAEQVDKPAEEPAVSDKPVESAELAEESKA